jgi:alpha-tubulin suppressor-like RCC1 family protein
MGWGDNSYGQLGHDPKVRRFDTLVTISLPLTKQSSMTTSSSSSMTTRNNDSSAHALSTSCGQCHSMAITSNGQLYSWGTNTNGVLGHNHDTDDKDGSGASSSSTTANSDILWHPRCISCVTDVIIIASSWLHSLCITRGGNVYTWGMGLYGALGHNSTQNEYKPRRVIGFGTSPSPLASTTLDRHTTIIDNNNDGKHDDDDDDDDDDDEGSLSGAGGQVAVAASVGVWHTCVVTDTGGVYTWGMNQHGQLGIDTPSRSSSPSSTVSTTKAITGAVAVPTFVTLPDEDADCISVACGSRHTLALTSTGDIYAWGCNAYLQVTHTPSSSAVPVSSSAVSTPQWDANTESEHLMSISSDQSPSIRHPTRVTIPRDTQQSTQSSKHGHVAAGLWHSIAY